MNKKRNPAHCLADLNRDAGVVAGANFASNYLIT
jgi:hypothetical protein